MSLFNFIALWQIRNHVNDYSNYFWIVICLESSLIMIDLIITNDGIA